MGKITKLSPATSRKAETSLRSTVPSSIVKQFNLKEGDKLDWSLEARKGDIIIIIKPIKES